MENFVPSTKQMASCCVKQHYLYPVMRHHLYELNGKQYIVIAWGGGKLKTKPGDSYIAFALPDKK
jgi:hypothetical protein